MDLSDKADSLLEKMLKKPLYVAVRTPNDLGRFGELIEPHLQWAIAAERRGELFAFRPVLGAGQRTGCVGRDVDLACRIDGGSPKDTVP